VSLIEYIKINKEEDNEWFNIESNKDGTSWKGKCWYIHNLTKYTFQLQFQVLLQFI
jgi:ufm1-conjugating enzyme 1